jgi:transcriptional regulator with XRE-family HTH domain
MDQQLALGRAVAELRRRRGLSQPELARLLDQPPSWVSQIERGLLPVDPLSLLGTVAGALGTPLPLPRERCDSLTVASPAITRSLQDVASGDCQRRVPSAARGPSAARSMPALQAQADQAWALARARHYGELAGLLSSLLPQLQDALRSAPDQQDRLMLQELLATSYQACAAALAKLGELPSAKAAASRALIAAQRAGDLLLAAASAYLLTRVLLQADRYAQADETARKAMAALAGPAADGRAGAISLRGSLALLRALTVARRGDPLAARELLGISRQMARQLDDISGARDLGLSRDDIALYETAVGILTSQSRPALARGPAR